MKKLILIRHAEADNGQGSSTKDIERPLTRKGFQDAFLLGKKLKEKGIRFKELFHSTAIRAEETAKLIGEQFQDEEPLPTIIPDTELYQASVRTLLSFVNNIDNSDELVIIVAHNPNLTFFSEFLTNESISFSPGTCLEIVFSLDSWSDIAQHTGSLNWIEHPANNI